MVPWQPALIVCAACTLGACGLVIDTTPATPSTDATIDSGPPRDAAERDTGIGDSSARDSAARDSEIPPPPLDSGPTGCARDLECDDGNPCTYDLCNGGRCESTANAEVCDDGIFCNGADQCNDGSCSVHAGEICVAGTVCDEALATCTGCVTAADCPPPVAGPWTACEGFAGTCDEAGTRQREVTGFSCTAGMCVAATSAESQTCARSTDGSLCVPVNYSPWSSCTAFSEPCGGGGSQTRTRSASFCSAGACIPTTMTESRTCIRPSVGTVCMGPSCTVGTCASDGTCLITSTTCSAGEICCPGGGSGSGGYCALPGSC